MRKVQTLVLALGLLVFIQPAAFAQVQGLPWSAEAAAVRARETPVLAAQMAKEGLTFGAPVYIAIYKQEHQLEMWVQSKGGRFALFKSYPICKFSGHIGPKLMSGDDQSPEGFYRVEPDALNANSHYHLSFDLGYPNAYDRAHGYTGANLMIHGDCRSIGCYAMTNPGIDEIYTLVYSALASGEPDVPVAIYPFRMTETNMELNSDSPWAGFWNELKAGYDAFQATGRPPYVAVADGRYQVTANAGAASNTTVGATAPATPPASSAQAGPVATPAKTHVPAVPAASSTVSTVANPSQRFGDLPKN